MIARRAIATTKALSVSLGAHVLTGSHDKPVAHISAAPGHLLPEATAMPQSRDRSPRVLSRCQPEPPRTPFHRRWQRRSDRKPRYRRNPLWFRFRSPSARRANWYTTTKRRALGAQVLTESHGSSEVHLLCAPGHHLREGPMSVREPHESRSSRTFAQPQRRPT